MRLSQSFYHPTEEPQIEVICKVYNINPENNQELKGKSPVLDGYTYFVEKVRDNQQREMNLEEAVEDAIEDCIRNHVLEDFFRNRKDEVMKVTHLDYTWDKREKLIRKEEYEEGISQGIQDLLLYFLEELGEIPEDLRDRIMAEKEVDTLKRLHKMAVSANSMEEFLKMASSVVK